VPQSSKSSPRGKPSEPAQLYADFPLFPHAAGRWGEESKKMAGRHVTINAQLRRIEHLLNWLRINGRRGLGFYTLRHVFETIAGESQDRILANSATAVALPLHTPRCSRRMITRIRMIVPSAPLG